MQNILKSNKIDNIIRVLFFLVGLLIMALGISLIVASNFGAGPWDAVNIGLSNHLGLSIGTCMNIVAIIQITIGGLINKKMPQLATMITSIILGLFIDFWMLFTKYILVSTFISKFLLFMLALVVVSIGVSLYLISNLPNTPLDYFMMAIKSKFNLSLMVAKISSESIGLVLGFILGGTIGFGTLMILLCVGPLIQFLQKPFTKLYHKLVDYNIENALS